MDNAFTSCKSALAEATMLSNPKPNAQISLTTDASEDAVGAVLEQCVQGVWQPLAFFSKRLRSPEQKYSTFDRELLGLYLAIRHFRFFLEGRSFTAYTDHKPLIGAMSKLSDPWTSRQQRHLAFISEFSTDIRHVSGKSNVVADCLSRAALSNVVLGIDYDAMAKAQTEDKDVKAFPTAITGLRIMPFKINNSTLLCDVSTGHPRPLVPRSFQRHVFATIHSLAHPGKKATVKLVSQIFVWHGLKKQVNQWTKECLACQQSKIQSHVHSPVAKIPVPAKRFSHLHIDLVGPLPPSEDFSHLLTIIDRTTRWPEAIPLSGTSTTDCARALIRHWISRFGVPLDITTLKAALKARLQGPNWADELPWVLLGLRTAPKEDFGLSAAELVYGIPLGVPGEFIDPTSKTVNVYAPNDPFSSCVQRLSPFPTSHPGLSSSSSVPQSLRDSKFIFIRNDSHRGPLWRPYDGPFRVVAPGDKTFRIMVGSREEVISADRLKPAYVDLTGPVTVAQPPRRGRPPLQQAEPTNQENAAELESSPPRQQSRSTRSGRAVHLPPRFR
ncbi:Pol polyprotein [Plakobranchus ocellatus]|uniref:Pol polyprotein n=1 Tax=Plakobranchus ocellatus TaxID=259542 RepID=A0AAV4DWX5_9GAST|nr:Pol polyprotein [Plakobranchus ocellatus]